VNILYLIFNRPALQIESFQSIRAAVPKRLFIAADGPRPSRPSDTEKCKEARRVLELIDWPCEVKTLFRDTNLGCRRAVVDAITWFFDQVDEGIIIEDDCVASQSFFDYASLLLDYYRNDTRLWCISGNNYQKGIWRGDGAYYFSRYSQCWGWATWKRCWQRYDESLSLWPLAKSQELARIFFQNDEERKYWTSIWDVMSNPEIAIDTWDYQWIFTVISNAGLTACPNRNLVTNVGYGTDATHCFGMTPDPGIEQFVDSIVHPTFFVPNADADNQTFRNFYRPDVALRRGTFFDRIKRRLVARFHSPLISGSKQAP
jgi:hypothetical protein